MAELTLVGAVVGLAWEFMCRVVSIVLFGAGAGGCRGRIVADRSRSAGAGREVKAAQGGRRFFKVGVEMK